jgi:hypothetical protein
MLADGITLRAPYVRLTRVRPSFADPFFGLDGGRIYEKKELGSNVAPGRMLAWAFCISSAADRGDVVCFLRAPRLRHGNSD